MFEKIIREIGRHDAIILHRHANPDGDALGSQIGLKHIIQDNFPDKKVYMVGDAAGRYSFIEDSSMDNIPDEAYSGALAIILDTSSPELISDRRYTMAKTTARIDHHIFVSQIANIEVVDADYESCCGLITQMAIEHNLKVSDLSAKALYIGMVTDSGRFRYDATSARTFHRAAFLMERQIDLNEIYGNLYASEFEQVKLRAMFTMKIQFSLKGVAYIYNTRAEVAALNMDAFAVSRGMVGVMSDIKGVDIWVNFTECENGVLAELRSSRYNINPTAVKFGGGGHAKASGATLKCRAEAMAMIEELEKLL